MIAIINEGPHDADDPMGERTYRIEIGKKVICGFTHRRSDGLAACLRSAADAVDCQMRDEAERLLRVAKDMSR